MIWESILSALVVLFLFWLFLNWIDKREVNKLRRHYDENRDTGRDISTNPGAIQPTGNGESDTNRDEQSEERRVFPIPDADSSKGDKRESEEPEGLE